MPSVTQKIEVGFDLVSSPVFFTLDDSTKGVLNNASYVLGGRIFYDITNDVQSVSYRRGKNRFDDNYAAGIASISLKNQDRKYDPTFTNSPYYGQIIPKRSIRISTEGVVQFVGQIDDWNLSYIPGNDSTASASASDGFGAFANQSLSAGTSIAELPGARITKVLDSVDVVWPSDRRNIDTGLTTLGADVISEGTNALTYLQRIERSEQGSLFISKTGQLRFIQRNIIPNTASAVLFSDDGTGIKYQELDVVYGSELLYNQTIASNVFGATAQADDLVSQNDYGVATVTYTDLLQQNTSDLVNMATWTTAKYSQPQYRFDSLRVVLDNLSASQKASLLNIELGDLVRVRFTPSSIPPAIEKFAEVIGISQESTPLRTMLTFTLSTWAITELLLDDANFGRLDSDNGLAY